MSNRVQKGESNHPCHSHTDGKSMEWMNGDKPPLSPGLDWTQLISVTSGKAEGTKWPQ